MAQTFRIGPLGKTGKEIRCKKKKKKKKDWTLSTPGKITSENFFLMHICPKIRFDISCKLSPMKTFCMKCQIQFSWKNMIKLSSAELAHRAVKVNHIHFNDTFTN